MAVEPAQREEQAAVPMCNWRSIRPALIYHLPQLALVLVGLYLWLRPIIHLLNGYWESHTGWYDPLRGMAVLEAWKAGMWDARWFSGFDYGYGYPFLSYYAPLFHWFSGAFIWLTDSPSRGTRLNIAMWMFIGTIGVYAASCRFWSVVSAGRSRPWFPGLFAALAWLMSPYLLVNAYVRGAAPELSSGQMLAWQLFACTGFLVRKEKLRPRDIADVLILFLALSCGLMLHNFYGLVNFGFAAAMVVFCTALRFVVHGAGRDAWRTFAPRLGLWVAAVCVALAATMFFWLPSLKEGEFVRTDTVVVEYFHYGHHFVEMGNLVMLNYWDWGGSSGGLRDNMPLHLGYISILGIVSAVIALGIGLFARIERRRAYLGGFLILFAATMIGLLFTMNASRFVWERIPLLQYAQFPWRLLTVPSLGIALLIPAPLIALSQLAPVRRAALFSLFALVGMLFFISHANYVRISKPAKFEIDFRVDRWHVWKLTTADIDEYRPRWRDVERKPSLTPGTIVPSEGTHLLTHDTNHHIEFDFTLLNSTDAPATATVAVNYFPPWRATADGRDLEIQPDPENAFVQILNIPPGQSHIRLWFANTPLRARAKMVSLIAWLIALGTATGTVLWLRRLRRRQGA